VLISLRLEGDADSDEHAGCCGMDFACLRMKRRYEGQMVTGEKVGMSIQKLPNLSCNEERRSEISVIILMTDIDKMIGPDEC
jgi:hypothetical protein